MLRMDQSCIYELRLEAAALGGVPSDFSPCDKVTLRIKLGPYSDNCRRKCDELLGAPQIPVLSLTLEGVAFWRGVIISAI